MAKQVAIAEVKSGPLSNIRWERFCQLYASDEEFFGNGVQSYIAAFGIDLSVPGKYVVARKSASDLLTKPHILRRINELLELRGLNNVFVDKQLEFLVTQNADFGAKIKAIVEFNKLKKRTEGDGPKLQFNVEELALTLIHQFNAVHGLQGQSTDVPGPGNPHRNVVIRGNQGQPSRAVPVERDATEVVVGTESE